MSTILSRINARLSALSENVGLDTSWKDPGSGNYDRQKAEDALFHTIGPLMETPRWVNRPWSSPGEPVPGYKPGGPAPQWTEPEIIMAYAGDPNLLFKGADNPKSPSYGNKGGAPLYRMARRVARFYAKDKDRSFIDDLYSNGFIPLVQAMKPGFDEGREPFISWITRNVQSAMEHGVGGEERTDRAAGFDSRHTTGNKDDIISKDDFKDGQVGQRGVKSLVGVTDPQEVRRQAERVQGKFQNERLHDKHPDNPFGAFSSQYYQVAHMYADALETGDEDRIEGARNQLMQLADEIEDYSIPIRGASTGLGQAISTPDRKTSIGIASMDAPGKGSNDTAGMAGNIVGDDTRNDTSLADPETIGYVLDIAINYDLGTLLKGTKYERIAGALGSKKGIGGRMTVNELRYVIRSLPSSLGANYPGKGRMRAKIEVPRDKTGWWQPGEDPEIEPIPTGGKWTSIWTREGNAFMEPTQIAREMTEEVREFNKLGIKTVRSIKAKMKKGKAFEEAVSNVSIITAIGKARVKLQLIADIHADELGIDDSLEDRQDVPDAGILQARANDAAMAADPSAMESIRRSGIISESLDRFDKMLVVEAARYMVRKLTRTIVLETTRTWRGFNVITEADKKPLTVGGVFKYGQGGLNPKSGRKKESAEDPDKVGKCSSCDDIAELLNGRCGDCTKNQAQKSEGMSDL